MLDVNLQGNRLLDLAPEEVRERLRAGFKPVSLDLGQALYRTGERLRYIYFPLDALVAKVCLSADGSTASLGVVGREGVVGMSSFLAGAGATTEAQVISPGMALRIGVRPFGDEFERGGVFQRNLLAFSQAFSAQTGQIAVCNRHHAVDQQLCFWLLLCFDRLSTNEMRITQELLASLLGVRREGVTRAALKLRKSGAVEYKHGRIKVPDPERLRAFSCECYYIVRNIYAKVLPLPK